MPRASPAIVGLCLCVAAASAGPVPPRLRADGEFVEWDDAAPLATDPCKDATGVFDVSTLYAASRGSVLFLRFDIGAVVNLQAGLPLEGTLRIEIAIPGGECLTIDLRNRRAYLGGDPGNDVSWAGVGFNAAPTFAAEEVEVRIDLGLFGAGPGSHILIDFSGSDSLAAPAEFAMIEPAEPPARRDWERSAGALRIASLNTEQTGTQSASRKAAIGRLLDAVDADIYCLQEEYNASAAQVAAFLSMVDPLEDGGAWSVRKNNDCVIASRSPIVAVPSENTAYAAGIVLLPEGPVLVLSIHPKCCGHAGSSEDAQRIAQTQGMITTIAGVRAGAHGPYEDAAVVVVGDWNLVGARTPLSMLEAAPAPALTRLSIPHLIGESVTTWRSASSSGFWPGTLDLLVYSASSLSRRARFVLDTASLDPGELALLGLQATDSNASDHWLIVADFAFGLPCVGDVDFNGLVNFSDLNRLLDDFSRDGADLSGDIDEDGDVDFADLNLLVPRLNSACAGPRRVAPERQRDILAGAPPDSPRG